MPKKHKDHFYAEYLNERIYGSVTLLAVNVGLLLHIESVTALSAIYVILSTTLGLWAASLFALLTSYRIIHKHNMPRKELLHEVLVHRGILMAALPSLTIMTLVLMGVTSLANGLIADIALAVTTLVIAIYRSSLVKHNNLIESVASVLIHVLVAVFIVALKLMH